MPISEVELANSDNARYAPLIGANDDADPKRHAVEEAPDDRQQFLSVSVLRTQYIDYLQTKVDEIEEQKESRRYYHGAHYTAEQVRILRARHQPPITWNRVKRKINAIVGLVERMRSDPKAVPTTPQSEQSANIATVVIREVLDANSWKGIEPKCLLQCGVDGIAGTQMVLTKGDKGDPDIALPFVIGDEYFYDPKSYADDFGDVRYEGIAKWLDVEEAIELFPDKEDLLRGLIQGDTDLTTNADREYKWIITATNRIRLVEHWYKHRGKWCWAFYVANVLLDQGISPFFDENGSSCSSFHMFACNVDQDGDRYGFTRDLKGPQDMLNQGKSKQLHIANSRRLILEKGAVDDVEIARREWARPDGVVEVNPGKNIKPDDTRQELAAFGAFTEDAKTELDGYASTNVAVLAGAGINQISGRALEILRQPGMAELGPFVLSIRAWKLKLYRRIWANAQRYWTAERWIRTTNDRGLAQFLQLNGVGLDRWGRPTLVNALGAVHVNIDFEEGPDIATVMDDLADQMKGYPPGTFPPQMLIEMSKAPRQEKNRLLAMMKPQPNPMQQELMRQQLEGGAIRNALGAANVRKTHAAAEQALATADERRTKAGVAVHGAHLDALELGSDTLREAAQLEQQFSQPQGAQQPQSPPHGGPALQPPISGARRARDGKFYVPDPRRPGKYLMVA